MADIMIRIQDFISVVFGKDNLDKNMKFFASLLSDGASESSDVIRHYFMSEFYARHLKKYQKKVDILAF